MKISIPKRHIPYPRHIRHKPLLENEIHSNMREAYSGMEDVRGTDDPEAELEAVVNACHGCNCTVANLN